MSSNHQLIFPWECRDKEHQAKVAYNHHLRRANQSLTEENMRLKRILRENGISWSQVALNHLKQLDSNQRKTRSSMNTPNPGRPYLPMEVLLRILKFAMASPYPIIDPLSPTTPENLSDTEKARGNQISIHFLATCKALHAEGTLYLWQSNEFVFTTPQAVRNFAELPFTFRQGIRHVNFRVIARYYDDNRSRRHKLDRCYHKDLKKDQVLKVNPRPVESPLMRGGFRCYTWNQVVDFLGGLRAPYDPTLRKKSPRPRLLPGLASLRLDLVNFSDTLLPFTGDEFHEMTSHELGCTLNELQVTGMPCDDSGMKASAELSGMLKDEGLYLDGPACFLAHTRYLQRLSGRKWCSRVIRAWKPKKGEAFDASSDDELSGVHHHHPILGQTMLGQTMLGLLPPAPPEEGEPPSAGSDSTIWKKVPKGRDQQEREWVQFSRKDGFETGGFGDDDDFEGTCPCCGAPHLGSSFMGFLMDELMEENSG